MIGRSTAPATRSTTHRGSHGLALSTAATTLLAPRNATLSHGQSATQAFVSLRHAGTDRCTARARSPPSSTSGKACASTEQGAVLAGTAVRRSCSQHRPSEPAGTPSSAATGWGGRLVDVLGTRGHLDAISVGAAACLSKAPAPTAVCCPANGQTGPGRHELGAEGADARRAALVQILSAQHSQPDRRRANKALAERHGL